MLDDNYKIFKSILTEKKLNYIKITNRCPHMYREKYNKTLTSNLKMFKQKIMGELNTLVNDHFKDNADPINNMF